VDSLRELQRLGAGVALDDFGTGYAPLLYLKQLGADDLKIDRSFVSGLGEDVYDTAIVASLISLAHNLNIRCVAEGVETLEQLELLRQLGCDFAQGYLFCRPTDALSLQVWLDRRMPAAWPGGASGSTTAPAVTPRALDSGHAEAPSPTALAVVSHPRRRAVVPAPVAERPTALESHDDTSHADGGSDAAAVAAALFTAGASAATTAAALNARGLTAPSGRRWHATSVKRLLRG